MPPAHHAVEVDRQAIQIIRHNGSRLQMRQDRGPADEWDRHMLATVEHRRQLRRDLAIRAEVRECGFRFHFVPPVSSSFRHGSWLTWTNTIGPLPSTLYWVRTLAVEPIGRSASSFATVSAC